MDDFIMEWEPIYNIDDNNIDINDEVFKKIIQNILLEDYNNKENININKNILSNRFNNLIQKVYQEWIIQPFFPIIVCFVPEPKMTLLKKQSFISHKIYKKIISRGKEKTSYNKITIYFEFMKKPKLKTDDFRDINTRVGEMFLKSNKNKFGGNNNKTVELLNEDDWPFDESSSNPQYSSYFFFYKKFYYDDYYYSGNDNEYSFQINLKNPPPSSSYNYYY